MLHLHQVHTLRSSHMSHTSGKQRSTRSPFCAALLYFQDLKQVSPILQVGVSWDASAELRSSMGAHHHHHQRWGSCGSWSVEAGHAGGIPERRLPSTAMAWTQAPSVSLPLSPFSSISSIKPQPYPVGSRFAGGDGRAGHGPSAADYSGHACIQTHSHTHKYTYTLSGLSIPPATVITSVQYMSSQAARTNFPNASTTPHPPNPRPAPHLV